MQHELIQITNSNSASALKNFNPSIGNRRIIITLGKYEFQQFFAIRIFQIFILLNIYYFILDIMGNEEVSMKSEPQW